MPRLVNRPTKYARHRASGQAVVTIESRDVYLGEYGSKTSRAEYDRVIAEWLAAGRRLPATAVSFTVSQLIARFWTHAQTFYRRPDGSPTGEAEIYREALRPLRKLYAATEAGSSAGTWRRNTFRRTTGRKS